MELKIYNPTMDNALKHIDWNFEELKKEVTEKANMYKSLVYTDENIKEAKADRAALNKFSKALNDGKKDSFIYRRCCQLYRNWKKHSEKTC